MRVKERKGWKSLDKDFESWFKSNNDPEWKSQKRWLSRELVKRGFVKEKNLLNMWAVFHTLTDNCSSWKVQSKILSFITLCMDEEIGEDLTSSIK
jgi:hypothetical protein